MREQDNARKHIVALLFFVTVVIALILLGTYTIVREERKRSEKTPVCQSSEYYARYLPIEATYGTPVKGRIRAVGTIRRNSLGGWDLRGWGTDGAYYGVQDLGGQPLVAGYNVCELQWLERNFKPAEGGSPP